MISLRSFFAGLIALASLATAVPAPAFASEKMCLFGIGGQSNATGFGERNGPNVPNTVWVYSVAAAGWGGFAQDPLPPVTGGGSMWPAFGSEFHNLTGIRVLFVKNTVNGGFQTDAANGIGGGPASASWDVNGTATPSMIAALQSALNWAASSGYDVKLCGMLWAQGEAEGNGIFQFPATVTKAVYKSAHLTMEGRFRTAFSDPAFPFYIFRTGSLSSAVLSMPANAGIDTGYAQVRAAQEEIVAASSYNLMASRMSLAGAARNQLIDPATSGVHYNQDLNDAMGLDAARRIVASGLWNRW
jgi:hypothetical protein